MDDESDTAKLVARAAKNVTFKLEDDEVADVDVPVSVSVSNGDGDGDEPSEIADGSVEPDMLWLDNTLIAHPLLGIGYFFLLWCARSAPAPPPRRRGRAPVRLTLPRARPPRTRAHRRASLFSRSSDLAAIFPFMFIPAILGIYWWYKTYRDDVSLTYLQSQFIIGFAPVSLSVTFLQLVSLMFWLGFVVAFIEGSKTLLGFSLGVAFYMFIAVTMVEELVKVSVAAHVRQQNAGRADSKSFVAGTVFMSLGLGTAQAIFMAIVIYSAIKSDESALDDSEKGSTMASVMVGVLSVAFINIPLHCLCGYLASIRVALRAFSEDGVTASSFNQNLGMAVFPATARTVFLTSLVVGLVALDGIGILLANILGLLIVYLMYGHTRREESRLPDEYRERVGYLSMFSDEGEDLGEDEAEMGADEGEEGVLESNDDVQVQ